MLWILPLAIKFKAAMPPAKGSMKCPVRRIEAARLSMVSRAPSNYPRSQPTPTKQVPKPAAPIKLVKRNLESRDKAAAEMTEKLAQNARLKMAKQEANERSRAMR